MTEYQQLNIQTVSMTEGIQEGRATNSNKQNILRAIKSLIFSHNFTGSSFIMIIRAKTE